LSESGRIPLALLILDRGQNAVGKVEVAVIPGITLVEANEQPPKKRAAHRKKIQTDGHLEG
jgi:hypothetical protein